MRTRRGASKQYVPDWVDILLAATLASWATVMTMLTVAAVVSIITNFRADTVAFSLGLLVSAGGGCFFIALFACVILGLPALGLASLLKLDKWWQAAIVGALKGLIFMVTITGGRAVVDEWNEFASAIVPVVAGSLAGVAARRERRKAQQIV